MQTQTVTNNIPANLGAISAADLEKLKPVSALENIPTLMPAKEGFEIGKTLAGYFVETRKVVSDKLTTSKRDENGDKYAFLHVLRDANNNKFGIWGKGQLDGLMKAVRPEQFVAITYKGVADAPLQKGQSAPHVFEVRA